MAVAGSALHVPGDTLEGGGQILRNAVAYAALLARPIIVDRIRQGRTTSGLKAQHLNGLQLIADISEGSTLVGAELASARIEFTPGNLRSSGVFIADPGTAGATALLLQVSLPCVLFTTLTAGDGAPTTLILRGGTNALDAPQIDYTTRVFLPFLQHSFPSLSDRIALEIVKRGYYPRGGGEVQIKITPPSTPSQLAKPLLKAITLLDRGKLERISGYVYTSGTLPPRLSSLMCSSAESFLRTSIPESIPIDIITVHETESGGGAASGLVLWAEFSNPGCILGGSAMGRKGIDARDIGRQAAESLLKNIHEEGCVDEWMQDQMIIFLALAQGVSRVKCGPLTLHTKTAIWIAEYLTSAKFTIQEIEDTNNVIIECKGIGLEHPIIV